MAEDQSLTAPTPPPSRGATASPSPSSNGGLTSDIEVDVLALQISDKVAAIQRKAADAGGDTVGSLEMNLPDGWTLRREEQPGEGGKRRWLVAVGKERELTLDVEIEETPSAPPKDPPSAG